MIPAALLGGLIVFGISILLVPILLTGHYIPPDKLFVTGRILIMGICYPICGVTFVNVATLIAPSHKKYASIVMAGVVLILSGITLATPHEWGLHWVIFSVFCLNIGSVWACLAKNE